MSSTSTVEYSIGQRVQDVRDRSKVGEVIDRPVDIAGRKVVSVRWQDHRQTRIPLIWLEPFREQRDVRSLLTSRSFGGIEDLVRNYTHRKLINPVDDTLYTLYASRTKLLPHQFKPLLKFLESVHRRFLIADEVGLGKTIEAGIVLSELRARGSLGGVLVLCPNHLRDKWAVELLTRFDERFQIVTSRREWIQKLERMEENGTSDQRLIVGYKTLASADMLERTIANTPGFDLLIVDEAHHFKNAETVSRRLLGELADAAAQLLLLTATPLQTEADNLLSLLRLIDHNAFESRELFADRLRLNQHLVRAERLLRTAVADADHRKDHVRAASEELRSISSGLLQRFGMDDQGQVARLLVELTAPEEPLERAAIAEHVVRVQGLNLLAPYITRTRKIEVQESCERRVETVRPDPLSSPEDRFYHATVAWLRQKIEEQHGERSVLFLSRNIERRLASSLQGFARLLLSSPRRPQHNGALLSDPPPDVIAAARAVGTYDTKFEELEALLKRRASEEPSEKIIIFASFRETLNYLHKRLTRGGWTHEVIHGGVRMAPGDPERNERGRRVERFLSDPSCRILLSSNVGGEGLDLQKASVVVNYDLPWNPATIEQRIGRVDRYGQTERVVRVMNFVLPGTVEDVIFSRLDERLQLFRTAIGDFAEVLGRIMNHLTAEFFLKEYTEEELQQKILQAIWRAERQRQDLDNLLERERELVAFDDDFADQLHEYERTGRTIKPTDLHRLVDGVFGVRFPKSWMRPASGDDADGLFDLYLDATLRDVIQNQPGAVRSGPIWAVLRRMNERGLVRVTFDGQVAERCDEAILLTSRHPFLKLLVSLAGDVTEFHRVASVRLPRVAYQDEKPGLLALFDAGFTFGPQKRRYLIPVWVTGGEVDNPSIARRLLREVLDNGQTSVPRHAPAGELLCAMLDHAEQTADAELISVLDRLVTQEQNRIRPRVAETRERYGRRIARADYRLSVLEAEGSRDEAGAKRLRHARDYVRRLQRERDERIDTLSNLPVPETTIEAVGATWLEFNS